MDDGQGKSWIASYCHCFEVDCWSNANWLAMDRWKGRSRELNQEFEVVNQLDCHHGNIVDLFDYVNGIMHVQLCLTKPLPQRLWWWLSFIGINWRTDMLQKTETFHRLWSMNYSSLAVIKIWFIKGNLLLRLRYREICLRLVSSGNQEWLDDDAIIGHPW